ncbi:von Willebrand factor A domain-containing protein 7-like [Branchiostoma floridae x Branchiostoma belcheri]
MANLSAVGMLRYLTVLTVLSGTVDGFLPNRLSTLYTLNANDYTHEEITQIGVLKAAAKFLEDNPPSGTSFTPGQLQNLDPFNPTTLFTAYYGEVTSAAKLQSAITEIIDANSRVDSDYLSNAEYHVSGEEIQAANILLITQRNSILEILSGTRPNFEAVRAMIGVYLHILQDFYSNTNWVELEGGVPYEDLAISGTTGKCSHGGLMDDSRLTVPTGGINKETSDPSLSPHHYLHEQAKQAAIQATTNFFIAPGYGLLSQIGADKFKQVLNLGSGNSMVFVIDVSGSMSDDVAAVRQESIQIVQSTLGTATAPYNYILSTFSDPEDLGQVRTTKDPDEMITWLNSLTVHGGGDCPEYCFSGIEQALLICLPESHLFIFTDADPKDRENEGATYTASQFKDRWSLPDSRDDFPSIDDMEISNGGIEKILASLNPTQAADPDDTIPRVFKELAKEVSPILTTIYQSSLRTVTYHTAHRRSNRNWYEQLAEQSGGSVYESDKEDIAELTGVISVALSNSAPVTLYKASLPAGSGRVVPVQVDSALLELVISLVAANSAPDVVIETPDGTPQAFGTPLAEIAVDVGANRVYQIKTPSPGTWRLRLRDSQHYMLEVTGKSIVDFSYQFMRTTTNGILLPIDGRPVAGVNTTIIVDVLGSENVQQLTRISLLNEAGDGLVSSPMTSVGGLLGAKYSAVVVMPTEKFRVKIEGSDLSNNVFQRVQPTVIQPQSFNLALVGEKEPLFAGSTADVHFLLVNHGARSTFSLAATDDASMVQSVSPTSITLQENANTTGYIRFSASSTAVAGTTSTTTLTVRGPGGSSNSLVVRVTVQPQIVVPVDNVKPTCTQVSATGGCTLEQQHPSTCVSHLWSIEVHVRDEESGVYSLIASPEGSGITFTHSPFSPGTVGTSIAASYSSNCCNPRGTITVADKQGNVAQCTVDYYIPTTAPPPTTFPPTTTALPSETSTTTSTPVTPPPPTTTTSTPVTTTTTTSTPVTTTTTTTSTPVTTTTTTTSTPMTPTTTASTPMTLTTTTTSTPMTPTTTTTSTPMTPTTTTTSTPMTPTTTTTSTPMTPTTTTTSTPMTPTTTTTSTPMTLTTTTTTTTTSTPMTLTTTTTSTPMTSATTTSTPVTPTTTSTPMTPTTTTTHAAMVPPTTTTTTIPAVIEGDSPDNESLGTSQVALLASAAVVGVGLLTGLGLTLFCMKKPTIKPSPDPTNW